MCAQALAPLCSAVHHMMRRDHLCLLPQNKNSCCMRATPAAGICYAPPAETVMQQSPCDGGVGNGYCSHPEWPLHLQPDTFRSVRSVSLSLEILPAAPFHIPLYSPHPSCYSNLNHIDLHKRVKLKQRPEAGLPLSWLLKARSEKGSLHLVWSV